MSLACGEQVRVIKYIKESGKCVRSVHDCRLKGYFLARCAAPSHCDFAWYFFPADALPGQPNLPPDVYLRHHQDPVQTRCYQRNA
jgi:hypothetical protein